MLPSIPFRARSYSLTISENQLTNGSGDRRRSISNQLSNNNNNNYPCSSTVPTSNLQSKPIKSLKPVKTSTVSTTIKGNHLIQSKNNNEKHSNLNCARENCNLQQMESPTTQQQQQQPIVSFAKTCYDNPIMLQPKCNGSLMISLDPKDLYKQQINISTSATPTEAQSVTFANNIINDSNNNNNNRIPYICETKFTPSNVINRSSTELVKIRTESLKVELDTNNNSSSSPHQLCPPTGGGLSPVDSDRKSRSFSAFSGISHNSGRRKSTLLRDESPYKALRELIIPCLIAGFGNVATGVIFAHVQTWAVFENVPQLNILVPALLGLKGNVEMTLASRLSTHANLGDLDDKMARKKLITSNMALVQTQASTVGFFAPLLALAVSYIWPSDGSDLTLHEAILLIAGSVLTANIANLFLGSLMCGVIVASRHLKINPDNIATPIAASFGDLTTMALLAYISHLLFSIIHIPWIQVVILGGIMTFIPFLVMFARKLAVTRKLLITGWFPICGAMILQITGGKIMENSLDQFTKLAAFQPVINGVGGNLAAVQTSRISTYLHRRTVKKQLPDPDNELCTYPGRIFFNLDSDHTIMARFLLLLSIPSHLLFIFVIKLVRDHFTMTGTFLTVYMIAAVIQVSILIQVSYTLVHFIWRKGFNPDNSALPFLTAFGDLIGSVLLALAFTLLSALGDVNALQPIPSLSFGVKEHSFGSL
ncbi:solute carrier family 41 member 1 [Tetranychus urticae]|uniref:SLC41A/MgtE integral membrane domain-containing protein n=1 Tax=Tetranychus urticae TaxID=32264 RepID=T1JXT4_TETUR|nr:solute carrier family 41 member 1 [Tetranychus urticae]XP_015794869.1 solute carrier family 41 member 1 [Tetranychus urticae]